MSLQFVIGSSGSGKTRYLYENLIKLSLEHPEGNYISIVPEQFTMQTQKEIVTLHPNHGSMNIDIVSFQRLAYRIFEELGVEHLEVLDDMGKSMVLRRVAAGQKKNLGLYGSHLNQTGFVNQLKSMLSELYQYGIQPENLREAMEHAGPLLCEKLHDISVVYEAFQQEIQEKYITAEEILDVLCRVLPRSELIRKSVVTLDGYTGFTPVQYRIVELLMRYAKQVIITVSIDPEEKPYERTGIDHLFYMGKEMIWRVHELAARNGIRRDQDVRLEGKCLPRFQNSPAIAFVEKNLYRYGRRSEQEPKEIRVFRAVSPGEEASFAASMIHRLVREQGIRYREIAVITGDLAGYRYEIVNRFEREKIPYFMDDKKSILENVMVEFIRAALDAVRKDFDYESMFRLLKTGLLTEKKEELDRLENYVIAMGVRGWKWWKETWERTYRGGKDINLDQLNAFKEEILCVLEPFRDCMKAEERTIGSMTDGVIRCLETCMVREKLDQYCQYFEGTGQFSLAKEYEQVYDRVLELLERLKELLGTEKATVKEYAEILDAGFAEIQVGVIPATVDRVVVGDITRTRLDRIRVLLFLGVNEGIVPGRKDGGSLLNDMDRETLKECQIELAPTSREDGLMQRYYLYLLLTKPSDEFVLSYASFNQAGKSMRPSSLISEMKRMFPLLTVQDASEETRKIYSLEEGKEKLIEGLRAYEEHGDDRKFLELYRYFAASREYGELTKKLTDAAFYSYEKRGISKAAASALYGTILQGSVTRLEKYAACAYAHFLNYGLELMERQEYQVGAADMGNLFHSSIDLCFQELQEQGKKLTELTEAERAALVGNCVRQVTEHYGSTIFQSTARNQYLVRRVEKMTERTIWALAEQLKKGDFEPAGFEVAFSAVDNLSAMKIRLSEEEQLHLRGRIDRLDLCEDQEHVYVKIIDYKSGGTRFDLAAVYYGLQLQLVVYMDAVTELEERKHPGKEVVPAGIFYYNIKDPLVDIDKENAETPEEIEMEILRQLRMNGLVNSDLEVISHMDRAIEKKSDVIPVALKDGMIQENYSSVASGRRFEILKNYVRRQLACSGREILDGNTAVEPYKGAAGSACDYCPYHGVCGFDAKVAGYRFRKFPAIQAEKIWEKMSEATEEDGDTAGRTADTDAGMAENGGKWE